MMNTQQHFSRIGILALVLLAGTSGSAAEAPNTPEPPPRRWLYLQTGLWPKEHLQQTLALLERIAGEGYNGVLFSDYKFMRWDSVPDGYRAHWMKFRETCSRLNLQLVAGVMPMGYSNGLLSRDPNLAEGLPVQNAPFRVAGGTLVPDDPVPLLNGGFESARNHTPAGWNFVDEPGKICFLDTAVRHGGNSSLRMQDVSRYEPEHRHARACQTLRLHPFRSYHVSVYVKTQDWDSGDTRIMALGEQGQPLSFQTPAIQKTQDWTRHDISFNTLESSTVKLYLGTWEGNTGTIWWDDLKVEPTGFINILRRPGTPLHITSAEDSIPYREGHDFAPIHDPKLGLDPWAGEYTAWHDMPPVSIPPGSRLREGQRVLASYFQPAIINEGQLTCCMSEPKVYEILAEQVRQVRQAIHPDGYMMMHDEIRVQGWDESCSRTGLKPADILSSNILRCIEILRKEDPGKPLFVWSDMFDPNHNARKQGPYYLVRGDGPWYGSWKHLPPDITIVNWQMGPRTRRDTLKHFSSLGHHQILAGYYDGSPDMITDWLKAGQGLPGIDGVMYTTWRADYSKTSNFLKASTK